MAPYNRVSPGTRPLAKLDCRHLLPWRPRLGWGLASDSSPSSTDRDQALGLRDLGPRWH